MTRILLNPPEPMSPRLERLRLIPGRHLGEDELERMQAYADARLEHLLAGAHPGILRGLEVDVPPARPGAPAGEGCTVRPGLAVNGAGETLGLFYESRATWEALIGGWLRENRGDTAAGVYYLVLRRGRGLIDADIGLDPCRRAERDPRRDTRIELLGTLALRRLALSPEVAGALTPERLQNAVAALHLDGAFFASLEGAVPLALLAVSPRPMDAEPPGPAAAAYQVDWVSQTAGRYLAIPDAGCQVLFDQVQEAFARAVSQALSAPLDEDAPAVSPSARVAAALEAGLRLDFLPAAGALPIPLLEAPDAPTPRLRWLPPHLGVDMVAVPEEGVPELIARHLPRRVIDLRRPRGERIRLLVAVNEPDYRADLLDIPQIDAHLVADLYRYHMRAHDMWREWRRAFDVLYHVVPDPLLDGSAIRALDLPRPYAPPGAPAGFYERLVDQARESLPPDPEGALPHPYRAYDGTAPSPPVFYDTWWGQIGSRPVEPPEQLGLVLDYRIEQVAMEALDNKLRALRARLEKTRDYLLLQRQQLDAQTVALTALGGGVAGDGSGLQVARWLPFTQLKRQAPAPATEALSFSLSSGSAFSRAPQQPTAAFKLAGSASSGAFIQAFGAAKPKATSAEKTAIAVGAAALKGSAPSSLAAKARSSSVEINLQRDRLDRLAEVPKQTLTQPAIEGRAFNFGVLEHIQAEVKEYEAAYRGMRDLIATLDGLFDPAEAQALREALEAFGVPVSPNALAADQRERRYPLGRGELGRIRVLRERLTGAPDSTARAQLDTIINAYATFLTDREITESELEEDGDQDAKRRYEALFQAGKILTRQIAYMEDRYNRLEDELEAGLRERLKLEGGQEKLAARIVAARARLDALDARRIERLGDYGVAQGLTREDWERVYRRNQERSRILTTGVRGLYYVRLRETPVSLPLTDPLALRYAASGDPVPGCDWSGDAEVAAELADFFDAVLEVPMGDWLTLAPLAPKLPPTRIPEWLDLRKVRFERYAKRPPAGGRAGERLAVVSESTAMLYRAWSVQSPSAAPASLGAYLADSARVVSLKDLLAGGSGAAQREAQALHNRLEQCAACLSERLDATAPSLRFEWAQLAEDDRLDTEHPETWPGLERAEVADFNAVRTLTELVDWWFRQLAPGASAAGRAALRNLIRAAVIVSAHGDPKEIVRGRVALPPRRFGVGESLRLSLDRVAAAGTRLQILDDVQRVVGLVAVKDTDAQGTIAEVLRVDDLRVRVNTRFTVVATRATAGLTR